MLHKTHTYFSSTHIPTATCPFHGKTSIAKNHLHPATKKMLYKTHSKRYDLRFFITMLETTKMYFTACTRLPNNSFLLPGPKSLF